VTLRAGVLWKFGGTLAEDSDQYLAIARHVAAGDGFVDPPTRAATAYRPPLYPLLLAGVLRCGGGTLAIGIVQLFLGVATVALTVACGRNLGLGRACLFAGLFVACDPLLLYQTVLVMTETTAAFLAALLVWLSLRPKTTSNAFWLGVVFGLACLCRPTFWAFGGLSALLWGYHILRHGRSPIERNGAMETPLRSAQMGTGALPRSRFGLVWDAGILVAGLMLVIAPWGIRNFAVLGRPIITTTHGGYTLLLAHNPVYTRAVVEQPWGAVWERQSQADWLASIEAAMAQENPPIDSAHLSPAVELARDQWMSRKAWKYLRDEPAIAVKTALTLLGRMWNVVPLATDGATRSTAVRLAIGTFYSALFLAVLIAVARRPRADWFAWRPVLVLIVGFTAVHSLYWADMRMRTPLVPAIALVAAAGLSRGPSRPVVEPRACGEAGGSQGKTL
jgi:4-amino-4-deoxy-L-arabinose transferase-like glycosyltransferase